MQAKAKQIIVDKNVANASKLKTIKSPSLSDEEIRNVKLMRSKNWKTVDSAEDLIKDPHKQMWKVKRNQIL
ncbi:hypothetical protein NITUZ_40167 [Candidatus Nitrosotenuis uzonensis]|uniref:Uncharacterized protein n=1 Tax=Candidatus Nitrosotenuis uzonensis TaxID=1407055 RepID=V6ATF6_9ARCH|nr:hypothetical protein NITUZ_40167 [Candidatus Nitrosotenuis uzonensis]